VRRYYRAGNSICACLESIMERVDGLRRGFFSNQLSKSGWRISLTLLFLAFAILLVALLAARIHSIDLSSLLLGVALATLCVVLFFLFRFLHLANEQHEQADAALDTTETSLLESEERFRQMADNIQEIFWMIDAKTRKVLYVNPAYETITGRPRDPLREDPLSYEEVIHSDDVAEGDYVVGRWEGGGTHTGPAFSDFLIGSLPAATGRKMRFAGTTVLKLKGGKIVEEIGLDDGVTALQQLGLLKAA
jgi:PAS domain-containing protein